MVNLEHSNNIDKLVRKNTCVKNSKYSFYFHKYLFLQAKSNSQLQVSNYELSKITEMNMGLESLSAVTRALLNLKIQFEKDLYNNQVGFRFFQNK